MRIFEVSLIVVNLLSLLLICYRQPKGIWVGLAGVNLVVFILHGVAEGLRYQMAFAYLLVTLMAVLALLKTSDRFYQFRTPKALKVTAAGLALVLLGGSALLAYALPVFALPQPTGSAAVGIQYLHLVDEQRADPFLDSSPQKRELMVKVYYPAEPDAARPYAPYFHNSPELIRAFTAFYNMPNFMFDHLRLVRTHSKEGLALSDEQPSYPVVLFSHGAGTSLEVQTAQCEDLASQGYIVADIDHTYVSAATLFPKRLVMHHEATTDFHTAEPAEIITQIMADDARFVIDQLYEINEGSTESIFKGRLALNHIGAIGHSVGGAAAYNLAINDPRIKAAIDLDGTVFITPKADSRTMAPFLMLANDKFHVQTIQKGEILMPKLAGLPAEEQQMLLGMYGSEAAYTEAYNKALQNMRGLTEVLKTSGNLFTITGSDHMKFSDIGLFIGIRPLRELVGIGGETEPEKCLEITEAVTRAFFDRHLKGEGSQSMEALGKKYPELKRVELE